MLWVFLEHLSDFQANKSFQKVLWIQYVIPLSNINLFNTALWQKTLSYSLGIVLIS